MKFFKIAQFFAAIDIERRRERAKDDSLLLVKGVEAPGAPHFPCDAPLKKQLGSMGGAGSDSPTD